MSTVAWDRLLETFCNREADSALLIAGSPPLLLLAGQWRALQVPPLSRADVAAMATEIFPLKPPLEEAGYFSCDFWFGNRAYFRALAWDLPDPRLVTVTRWPARVGS